MEGTGEHHSERSQPGSEYQNSYVLPHMQTLDLRPKQQHGWTWSHDKGRTHMGDTGIDRKPKTWKHFWCPHSKGANTETLKRQRLSWEGEL
jgi:hypothetical protein